jgi:hypothetical protein
MWQAYDAPGMLQHLEDEQLVCEVKGGAQGQENMIAQSGFLDQVRCFLQALRQEKSPSPSLAESRQSVLIADCIRERRAEFSVG